MASNVVNGYASLADNNELLLKSLNYRFMRIQGCKLEYEPSMAPNESYPLRNGTFGVHFQNGGFLNSPEPTDATNAATPINGIWSPWKPFKLYFNVAKHLAKHRQNSNLTFTND